MACMCGDTHCPSYGPAQGNSRCPICKAWFDDGCEHVDENSGEVKPEFEQAKKDVYDVERLGNMIEDHQETLEELAYQRRNLANTERREVEFQQEIRKLQEELQKRGIKYP